MDDPNAAPRTLIDWAEFPTVRKVNTVLPRLDATITRLYPIVTHKYRKRNEGSELDLDIDELVRRLNKAQDILANEARAATLTPVQWWDLNYVLQSIGRISFEELKDNYWSITEQVVKLSISWLGFL